MTLPHPRFTVSTVTGYLTEREGRHRSAPGVSAHVHDQWYGGHVVAIHRSEDYAGLAAWSARYSAVVAAQRHAERLNAREDA